jgi:hypothetical protein
MKRKFAIKVPFENGKITANVTVDLKQLTRVESSFVVDKLTENVANALRDIPFHGTIPIQRVRFR